MTKILADVMKLVKEKECTFVDFRFVDTKGKEQHTTLPISHFDEDKFESGPCIGRLLDRSKCAEAYLNGTGLGDTAFFGPEPEFFIFDDVCWGDNVPACTYTSLYGKTVRTCLLARVLLVFLNLPFIILAASLKMPVH